MQLIKQKKTEKAHTLRLISSFLKTTYEEKSKNITQKSVYRLIAYTNYISPKLHTETTNSDSLDFKWEIEDTKEC